MAHIDTHAAGTFCWAELATTDQDAAKKFYAALFDWKVEDSPIGPAGVYTKFQIESRDAAAAYTLEKDQVDRGVPTHWNIYIAVKSADDTAKRAAEFGGKILLAPFDVFDFGRMAVIEDPAGATFCIWEAKAHHGSGIGGWVDGTFCWADLSTPDPDTASKFYSNLFGWKTSLGEDNTGYLRIVNGETPIGGIPPAKYHSPELPAYWMSYFKVSDCDSSTNKAKELGGNIAMPSTDIEKVGRMSIVQDPQGAMFALFQPAPRV